MCGGLRRALFVRLTVPAMRAAAAASLATSLLFCASASGLRAFPALPLARARPQQRAGSSIRALDVLIDDKWFDLSRWRAAHPSGPHWIDGFDGCDATEVMHAFHSDDAMAMLARLPQSRAPPTTAASEPTDLMLAFRRFRVQLLDEGWFERVWWREAATLAPCLLLYVAGTVLARRCSALATVLLALGSTSAGWIAHDYVHGRGRFCAAMRGFGAFFNGHSASWWSAKHHPVWESSRPEASANSDQASASASSQRQRQRPAPD